MATAILLRRRIPAAIRKLYPNAYQSWTRADEQKLVAMYQAGQRDYTVLGAELGRQPSAIRSRLEKIAVDRL
ncbi:hypothetical protein ABUW04_26235 [Streptacidiphilus sp. N1-10]|uniref:RNA polymerase sigma factor 70 region 4 type 2 domain-containing protein n=1 Tax=Streptacidiphilus jeojiensis TaxID=3229225 RepID=A0ABV6XV12_9ACTN